MSGLFFDEKYVIDFGELRIPTSSTTIDVRLKEGLFALTSASSDIRDFQYGGDKPSNEKHLCLFTVLQSGEVKFS